MFAARGEHVRLVIEPALRAGRWVVCDRFSDATYAYQCGGRSLPTEFVTTLEGLVHPGLQPDATFLFDIDPALAYERQRAQSRTPDRFERERADFRARSRGLPAARAGASRRFHVIDASGDIGWCASASPRGSRRRSDDAAALAPRGARTVARGPHAHSPRAAGARPIGHRQGAVRPRAGGERAVREAEGGLACATCPSCHWFSQGNHPDYREIVPEAAEEEEEGAEDAAKAEKAKSVVIKIDQIRAIADFVAPTTHRAGYRVLVLRPAEALQPAAANALLKTLEEPPRTPSSCS